MSIKTIACSQSSSPRYFIKKADKVSSSPSHRPPGTNERPGQASLGLCSGAVVGQEDIPSLTSGRATPAQPAWSPEDPFGSKALAMDNFSKALDMVNFCKALDMVHLRTPCGKNEPTPPDLSLQASP